MKELPKAYEPKQYEDAIYKRWEESGLFNPDNLSGEPYSLMMPPPNVTGVLHLGHALENSLMDTMIRFQRMRGKKALLVPGTDHAALPTQAKVEKMLMQEGVANPRKELGREALVAKIREFADNSKTTILSQIRKMGTSADWSRLAYTFDEARNKAVNELFARMYNDGLIYRGYRVVNWSVKGQSTSSDDEIETIERTATLYTFKYSADFPIAIASTRPETKLGDTAVAVHPSDERYVQYIGQTFTVDVGAAKPLQIRIIADENVDPAFGTGALGVTPAHSPIDFAMYEKQKAKGEPIGIVQIIGMDGRMTSEAGSYAGLAVEETREKFVIWLRENSLLISEQEVTQNVGTSDRYGDVIEAIPMTQWWLDVNKEIPGRGKTLRDLMREAVTTGLNGDAEKKVRITPNRFTKLYLDRVDNLRDWCLSRQIWWGHRIPAWYRGDEIFVGTQAPEGEGWVQDEDTLDTWFSSSTWTFSTLGWPEKTEDLQRFHPTSFMQMGYEILYLWLMRMILMSAFALEDVPFKDAYIHGMLRDKNGQKFSKSLGNGIDPLDVIETYGTDALRFSLLVGNAPGNDAKFYLEKVEGAQHLVNKLWNMSRFILSSSEFRANSSELEPPKTKTLADEWILDQLNNTTIAVSVLLEEKYNFSGAGEELRKFTWDVLADWYLEIAKIEGGKSEILEYVLNVLLRLWHPFMPFVTEAIWQEAYSEKKMLMVEKWPSSVIPTGATPPRRGSGAEESLAQFTIIQNIITGVRSLRADYHIEPAKKLSVSIATKELQVLLDQNADIVKGLARIESLTIAPSVKKTDSMVSFVARGAEVFIDLAGVVDIAKEKARIEKELGSVEPYMVSLKKKLQNEAFVQNAAPDVVEKEQQKLTEAKEKLEKLKEQLKTLS